MPQLRSNSCDFLVIGAGIVGLAIAREIKLRFPDHSIVILEKEDKPGLHASGRNSGVLHSGIYYPTESLKARVCASGARELSEYCRARNLPINNPGKILVPSKESDGRQLDLLEKRGLDQGIEVHRLDWKQLREIEPHVRSATGQALLIPTTAVVSSSAVVDSLVEEVTTAGVVVKSGATIMEVDSRHRRLKTTQGEFSYGHVINCAGSHADKVAHLFGAASHYTVLPFRGRYWKLDTASKIKINHLIYPVPDLRVPFLGVHTTTAINGDIYLGPTATPAFGRENYFGLHGINAGEAARIGLRLGHLFLSGKDGFRRLAIREAWHATKPGFLSGVKSLLPEVRSSHLLAAPYKTGIRPQMLDLRTGRLEMDFKIEQSNAVTHILNAISPAFTSSFPLARYIVDNYIEVR